MIDPRIIRFIRRHHLLTLATSAGDIPYCSHAFYGYDEKRDLLVFAADATTRHGQEMLANKQAAVAIGLESKVIGKLQGLQLCGAVHPADDQARRVYLHRFPYAALTELTLWMIEPTFLKFTDNTLGFGKKLIWNSEK